MKHLLKITVALLSLSYITSCSVDDDPIDVPQPKGTTMTPNVGGPAEPNQVWIDLDQQIIKVTKRHDWDFGFYNGDEFRVIINSSIMMAATQLEANNIDLVTESQIESLRSILAIGNFRAENIAYTDDIRGNFLNKTAINEISPIDSENKVYLINMGSNVYEGNFTPGTVYTGGEARGWKKIRILRNGQNGYRLQYADATENTHKEIIINKQSGSLFSFFSIEKGMADIQPESWDLCFTIGINEVPRNGIYIFADFVTTNVLNNVGCYQVLTSEVGSYESFSKNQVDQTKFIYDDQRVIGSNWRVNTRNGGASVSVDRFYVIKDNVGTMYKLRFLRMTNNEQFRGYPEFEYDVL